jgi:hypothetical protein
MNMRTRAKALFDAPAPFRAISEIFPFAPNPKPWPFDESAAVYVTDYTIAVCGKSRPPRDCHA